MDREDVLSEALGQFGMTGVFYCACDLSAPWGVDLPAMPGIVQFHLVSDGAAVVEVEGESVTVRAGDVVLVPHGSGHLIRSVQPARALSLWDIPRVEAQDRYERVRIDGGGEPTTLLCGALEFSDLAVGRLMSSLPPVVAVSADEDLAWARATMELMLAESRTSEPGSTVVTTRLADVLIVQAVRSWLRANAPERGWLAGIRDPNLGRAIAAFHADPGRAWDLPALAQEAGLSRSAFAARFTAVLGETPMAYVTSWRMDLAAHLVETGRLSLASVAERVGYRSEAAFNRAFRRAHGMTPGTWRRQAPLAVAVGAAD